MASATGVTLIKRFTYRGQPEDYSNTYWLTMAPPSDATAWRTLVDALVTQEKTLYQSAVTIVKAYGYNDDTGHKSGDEGDVAAAVYGVDFTVAPETPIAGTGSFSSVNALPGDDAVWVRWKTTRLNSKGKAIYLRKYIHPAYAATGGSQDIVAPGQVTALNAFGLKMRDGTFAGGRKITAPGYQDAPTAHGASSWVTTRTLKRRGKRPNS